MTPLQHDQPPEIAQNGIHNGSKEDWEEEETTTHDNHRNQTKLKLLQTRLILFLVLEMSMRVSMILMSTLRLARTKE
jgi:hypothetical protein